MTGFITRGEIRRFLVAFSIANTVLSLFAVRFIELSLDITVLLLWVFISALLLVWLTVDVVVVRHYLKRIRPLSSLAASVFMEVFFAEGASWKELRERAVDTEKIVRGVLERGKHFPELNIPAVIEINGIGKALELIQRAEQRVISKVEERVRSEDTRTSGVAELVRSAVTLGIDEGMARSLAISNIDRLRTTVAQEELKRKLLAQAAQQGCLVTVQPLVELGALAEAEMALVKVASYIARATELGVEKRVRALIAKNDLASAMRMLDAANEKRIRS